LKIFVFTFISIAFTSSVCKADDVAADFDYKAELKDHFPEYDKVIGPFEHQKSSLNALERLKDGVLVGDFNADDITDFAAKISRPIRDDEVAQSYPSNRSIIKTVQMIVVCNGQDNSNYRCYELSEEKIGGISGTLDQFDWEWYLSTLHSEDQPACQEMIRSRIGLESLSLVEPVGHCDVFYYPREEGNYDKCMFCAD